MPLVERRARTCVHRPRPEVRARAGNGCHGPLRRLAQQEILQRHVLHALEQVGETVVSKDSMMNDVIKDKATQAPVISETKPNVSQNGMMDLLAGKIGEWTKIVGERGVAVRHDYLKACEELNPEFVTVFYGADVAQEDAEAVGASLTDALPEAEISVVDGGQPVYYYMISIE